MEKQAKITSKGQITVPLEVRLILGVRAGDKLVGSERIL
jgi:AbrB family looped-hinge helix DNA binding protein